MEDLRRKAPVMAAGKLLHAFHFTLHISHLAVHITGRKQ